ncbi:hypothetical protein F2Q68_00022874 [Brassica cretica]|uniref:Uncharacterized protein n=2 Tax=Brassica cretica TaxID=69181 RepID=A0ABQ7CZL6_BRACR|nr:hypothetical protein F2Q68_00022874 [Brassica cretica]KAF3565372.1 hypothetical protein DY000_02019162 [Brassica cretica]
MEFTDVDALRAELRVSSKLSDGGAALVFTGDTIFVYWRFFLVMPRSTLALYSLGYSYSFESDAMLDVWVILDLWFMALVVCSPIIVFNLVCGAVFMCFSSWWQLKEKIIGICSLVNMVMAGIDCPLGSCYSSGLSLVQWL